MTVRRSRLAAALALTAGCAAAQPPSPSASPTFETSAPTLRPTGRPSPVPTTAAPTYWTPAPFAAPPDDYDRDTFDHDVGPVLVPDGDTHFRAVASTLLLEIPDERSH